MRVSNKISCGTHTGTGTQERIARAKSRAVHTQEQATGTYSRGEITCSTHSGTSDRSVKQRQNHVQYTLRDK